jgi:hypothetical protein
MQFINPKNGSGLKIETKGHLVHINDILPDIIKIVIPFKDGKLIILDTVETKYFYNYCVINAVYVTQDSSKFKECSGIVYYLGDRVIIGKMFCHPGSKGMQVNICPNHNYYNKMTNGINMNLSKRLKLFRKNLKRRFPGYQF